MAKRKKSEQSITNKKELSFQTKKKEKLTAQLRSANKKLTFQNKKQQELFASIVNSSDDAILSKTLDGIITSWNRGAEEVFGYAAAEIVGKSISMLIPEHLLFEEKEIIEKIVKGELVDHYETQRVRKDGSIIDVSLTVSPIKDNNGNIIGASKISRDITFHRQVTEKLIASEKQFRHTLDNMLEGIQLHDFNWRYLYVNDALVRYSHYSREELIGHTIMEKYPGIEQTDLFLVLKRCMTDRVAEHFETEFVFPDGSKADFELSIEPIPEGLFILSIDISESKKAKEKLLKSNRLYSFLSAINQSIVHIKDQGELLDRACKIATEIGQFKMAWIALLDENGILNRVSMQGDEVAAKKILRQSLDCNDPALQHIPTVKAINTGKYFFNNDVQGDPTLSSWKEEFALQGIQASISLPIFSFKKVVGIFGLHAGAKNFFDEAEIALLEEAASDISFAFENFEKEKQRKNSEENLRHSETRLKEAQAIAQIGNWEVDMTREMQSWSDELYRLFGVEESVQPSTEMFLSFIHPEDVIVTRDIIDQIFGTLKGTSFDFRFINTGGQVRYGSAEARFEFDEHHKPIRLYGIVKDVTEQKQAEEEREKITNDIIHRNKDLEQFAYIVSHNLRAPVANIIGISQLLTNTIHPNKEEQEMMLNLSVTIQKLDATIKDLNTILQVKREVSEKKTRVRFSELVSDIKISISNLIADEKVSIRTDFSEVDEMSTLKSYLYSIFYNLISNSIKYRQPGSAPEIEIVSRKFENRIILFFRDNGLGIDLAKKGDQVFGLYKRFHSHTEGKGMGLFIVKTQVETLGGKISLLSEVNRGTEFKIEFENEK